MKPLHVVSVVFLLSLANSLVKAADEPSQKANIERLRERVSQLEIELKAIRQEFAALNAALREGAANRSRSSVTQKTLDIKVIDGGWGDASGPDIRAVCLSAAQELWKHFPDQTIAPILIRYSDEGPMVIFGRGSGGERRVLLNVSGTYWAQFAFQFPHEFCHILCNYREANNPNLWFEESICEAASLFAMRRMAETWKTNPPYPNWKSFAVKLSDYAENRIEATKLDQMNLAKWYRQHEETLRKNGTDRAKNRVVAVALLGLIEKSPQDWRAVTHLNQWDKGELLSFEAYLADWYRRVPEQHKPFVADVGNLFAISLSQ